MLFTDSEVACAKNEPVVHVLGVGDIQVATELFRGQWSVPARQGGDFVGVCLGRVLHGCSHRRQQEEEACGLHDVSLYLR